MTVIYAIIRILVILIIVRLVLRFIAGFRSVQTSAPRRASRVPERVGGTLVRDPQCGTYIPEARAVTMGAGVSAIHFCSTACRDAWREAQGSRDEAQDPPLKAHGKAS